MDTENSLLVIVDVQNGFVSDRTNHVLSRIKTLIEHHRFGATVFTQFYNQDDSPYERYLSWSSLKAPTEQAIADPIAELVNENVWRKPIYTGVDQRLLSLIEEHNFKEVYIAGIDTDCCVLTTAIDLFQRGIRPIVLADYSASNGGPSSHDAALLVLRRTIGERQIHLGDLD